MGRERRTTAGAEEAARIYTEAQECHRGGRLADAKRLYRAALAIDPRHAESLHNLGLIACQLRSFDAAVRSISQAIELDGGQAHYHCSLGVALKAVNRQEDALAAYDRALRLKPDYLDALFNRANVLRDLGRAEEAMADYAAILRIDPHHFEAQFNLGITLQAAKRFEDAVSAFDRALALQPDSAPAHYRRGWVLHHLGQCEAAVAAYDRSLVLQPDNLEGWINKGNAFRQMERLEEALDAFTQAITLKPGNMPALMSRSAALQELGRVEAALEDLDAILRIKASLPEVQCQKANLLFKMRRLEEAVEAYRAAIALSPNYATAQVNMALALKELGRGAEALAVIDGAICVMPDLPEAHNTRGQILKEMGQLNDAIDTYKVAIKLRPTYAGAYNNLGNALRAKGNFDAAASMLQLAAKFDPDCADIFTNLAGALKEGNRLQEGKEACEAALRLNPDSADALTNLGAICRESGDLDKALECYRAALHLNPYQPDTLANLAALQEFQGDLEGALASVNAALKVDPNHAAARSNRAFIYFGLTRLKEAWADYESRWGIQFRHIATRRVDHQPRWHGEPVPDKRVLVWSEQGIADELLGMSMLPDVAQRAGRLIMECDRRLVPLMARSMPQVQFVARQAPPALTVLEADLQIPLMSLGATCRTDLSHFPKRAGFVVADPAQVERWRRWLDGLGPGPKLGVLWRRRLSHNDKWRHMAALEELAPIYRLPGVSLVSLQYDSHEDDAREVMEKTGATLHCPPWLDLTNDLDGCTALSAALDAVVGPMTAAAALAAAVGCPTWLYIRYPGSAQKEMMGQDHMPWYPSARVHPCLITESWERPIAGIAEELGQFLAGRS